MQPAHFLALAGILPAVLLAPAPVAADDDLLGVSAFISYADFESWTDIGEVHFLSFGGPMYGLGATWQSNLGRVELQLAASHNLMTKDAYTYSLGEGFNTITYFRPNHMLEPRVLFDLLFGDFAAGLMVGWGFLFDDGQRDNMIQYVNFGLDLSYDIGLQQDGSGGLSLAPYLTLGTHLVEVNTSSNEEWGIGIHGAAGVRVYFDKAL